jgi:hypothetical protein
MLTQRIFGAVIGATKPVNRTTIAWERLVGTMKEHRLFDVVLDGPAFLDSLRDGRKIVVRKHLSAASFVT